MAWPAIPGQNLLHIHKVVADAGTPEPISATSKRVRRAAIYGIKDTDPVTANAAVALLGNEDVQAHVIPIYDGTQVGNDQGLFTPQDGYIDLSEVYIKVGANDDGVLVFYVE